MKENQACMESFMMLIFDWEMHTIANGVVLSVLFRDEWVKTMLVGSILDYERHCDISKPFTLFLIVVFDIVRDHCLFNNASVLSPNFITTILCAHFVLLLPMGYDKFSPSPVPSCYLAISS